MVFALCLATEKAEENGEERALDFESSLLFCFLNLFGLFSQRFEFFNFKFCLVFSPFLCISSKNLGFLKC